MSLLTLNIAINISIAINIVVVDFCKGLHGW